MWINEKLMLLGVGGLVLTAGAVESESWVIALVLFLSSIVSSYMGYLGVNKKY